MFYTYVLFSKDYNKIYIGYTSDIEGRLTAHNHHLNKGWTKTYKPWTLLYSESFPTKLEAMKREKQLKTSRGRAFIKDMIR